MKDNILLVTIKSNYPKIFFNYAHFFIENVISF